MPVTWRSGSRLAVVGSLALACHTSGSAPDGSLDTGKVVASNSSQGAPAPATEPAWRVAKREECTSLDDIRLPIGELPSPPGYEPIFGSGPKCMDLPKKSLRADGGTTETRRAREQTVVGSEADPASIRKRGCSTTLGSSVGSVSPW
jgi:hypothetical protein